jgi:hypothetical protein
VRYDGTLLRACDAQCGRRMPHAGACRVASDRTDSDIAAAPPPPPAKGKMAPGPRVRGSQPTSGGSGRSPSGFRLVRLVGLLRREMPSRFILLMSVERLRPSFAAAPFAPPITHPTESSVLRISVRSDSRSVVAGAAITLGVPVPAADSAVPRRSP